MYKNLKHNHPAINLNKSMIFFNNLLEIIASILQQEIQLS